MKASFIFGYKSFSDKNQICYFHESRILYTKNFLACGENHDWQRPNLKPLQVVELYCEDFGYEYYETQGINIDRVSKIFLKVGGVKISCQYHQD